MRIDILSAVPDLLRSPLEGSIIGRARRSGVVDVRIHDLHDFSQDRHRKVDDTPYGGGAGMVLTPQPIFTCVEHIRSESSVDEIIFTTPSGDPFVQRDAEALSMKGHLVLLCGHYKGVDQRVRDHLVTKEYSIGDVVLSGGELPVLMIVDAVVRLLPGAIGDAESALTDSFQEGLLEGPVYTKPATFGGHAVPEVLRSGDHRRIEAWRHEQALELTKRKRPDLYRSYTKNP